MGKTQLIIFFALIWMQSGFAQTDGPVDYKRSSLHLILIDQNDFFNREAVKSAFFSSAFPDQYDKVNLEDSILNIRDYVSYMEERQRNMQRDQKIPSLIKTGFTNELELAKNIFEEDEEEIRSYTEDYIQKNDLARQIVADWFQRDKNGTFSMENVQERGLYNADLYDVKTAKESTLGKALLKDAGETLIGNTFIIFNNIRVVDNKQFLDAIKMRTAMLGRRPGNKMRGSKLGRVLNRAKNKVKQKARKGYNVWTTAYLYQLKWTEEVQAHFFNDLWISRNEIDSEKKSAFENTDIFELEFVGYSYSQSVATEGLWKKQSHQKIVEIATLRNIGNTYAELQKEYDVFKPISALSSVDPITAQIGMKEGLEGKEKFEVLEIIEDPETGIQNLDRVDIIKTDPDKIWDNRYNADLLLEEEKRQNSLKGTHFTGGSNKIYPGMFIRQIK